MADAEIIELEGGEPERREPWRPGSLSLVAAPVLAVVALVVALVSWNPGREASGEFVFPGRALPTSTTTIFSRDGESVVTFAPAPTSPLVVPPPAVFNGETGDNEIGDANRWSTDGPPYPGRSDVADAVLGGRLYVIGGSGLGEDGRVVYRYDPATGTRERLADLPLSLDHAMAAPLNGRVYVFGGFSFARASARVFSLGPNDTSWVEHAPMPTGRAAGGAAVVDERVYLVGGVGVDGGLLRELWAYDASGRWGTRLAPLPTPRDHLAVSTYGGRVCAAGGNGGEQAFECYDTVLNRWAAMPPLRKPVVAGRAAEAAGWFWVVHQDVHVFTTDHWHFGPRLAIPRGGHAMGAIDGSLYVVEGALGPRGAAMEVLRPVP